MLFNFFRKPGKRYPSDLIAKMPKPAGICPDCLRDPLQTRPVSAKRPSVVFSYCHHHKTGGVIDLERTGPACYWQLYSPISPEDFRQWVQDVLAEIKTQPAKTDACAPP